jgi:hypothetical protein
MGWAPEHQRPKLATWANRVSQLLNVHTAMDAKPSHGKTNANDPISANRRLFKANTKVAKGHFVSVRSALALIAQPSSSATRSSLLCSS